MATSWLSPLWSHPIGARILYYPTLLFGITKTSGDRRWYDRIDDKVILGALPFRSTAKKLVATENVTRVVTLNESYETRCICPTENEWNLMGVEQICFPTVDYNNAPTMKQIKTSIKFIKEVENGTSVYVHCKAGRSRSATVVLCYLISQYDMNATTAFDFVKSKRPHIVLGQAQTNQVDNFFNDYRM